MPITARSTACPGPCRKQVLVRGRCLERQAGRAEAPAALEQVGHTSAEKRDRLDQLRQRDQGVDGLVAVERRGARQSVGVDKPNRDRHRHEPHAFSQRDLSRQQAIAERSGLGHKTAFVQKRLPRKMLEPVWMKLSARFSSSSTAFAERPPAVPQGAYHRAYSDLLSRRTVDQNSFGTKQADCRRGFQRCRSPGEKPRQNSIVRSREVDISALGDLQPSLQRRERAEILFIDQNDQIGMSALAVGQHLAAVIGRGIVDDDDLVRRSGLACDRIDRARQILGMIVVRQYHRKQLCAGTMDHSTGLTRLARRNAALRTKWCHATCEKSPGHAPSHISH